MISYLGVVYYVDGDVADVITDDIGQLRFLLRKPVLFELSGVPSIASSNL